MNSRTEAEKPLSRRTVQIEAGPNQRLEIEISDAPGAKHLTLRELSWGNGVGWFVHKSIRLESGQVDALLRALCCLRQPAATQSRCPLVERPAAAESNGKACDEAALLRIDFREARRSS